MYTSENELAAALEVAESKVPVGSRFAHYKDSFRTYVVQGFSIWEPTDEVAITYTAEYGQRLTFTRLFDVFIETVESENKNVSRFMRLD